MMFINLSNHPVASWNKRQLDLATTYGMLIDIPFPNINPRDGEEELRVLCETYLAEIHQLGSPKDLVIHLMGEMSFTFLLVDALMSEGYRCLSSTTKRIVNQSKTDVKEVTFEFVQFRDYFNYTNKR